MEGFEGFKKCLEPSLTTGRMEGPYPLEDFVLRGLSMKIIFCRLSLEWERAIV
jgi:hypothetical protein